MLENDDMRWTKELRIHKRKIQMSLLSRHTQCYPVMLLLIYLGSITTKAIRTHIERQVILYHRWSGLWYSVSHIYPLLKAVYVTDYVQKNKIFTFLVKKKKSILFCCKNFLTTKSAILAEAEYHVIHFLNILIK